MRKTFFGLLLTGLSAVLISSSDSWAQGVGFGTPIGGAAIGPRGTYVGPGYGGVGVYGPGVRMGVGSGYTSYGSGNYGYSNYDYNRGWTGQPGYYHGYRTGGYGRFADYDDDCDD